MSEVLLSVLAYWIKFAQWSACIFAQIQEQCKYKLHIWNNLLGL